MEYLVDPDSAREEEGQPLEIDPGLLLRKDHLSWLLRLIDSIPMHPAESVNFCISCCRYLAPDELVAAHRHNQPAAGQSSQSHHHLFPLLLVQCRRHNNNNMMGMGSGGGDNYVSVQALRAIQVPIGDVLSHVLPHPHPQLLVNQNAFMGNSNLARCMYVHPQTFREEMWQGETLSGRCAYRDCERIFNNRQSHLRLYGITPQFCSINCKIKSWLACNK